MSSIVDRVKEVRAHFGETQKSMSRRLSLGESTWQNYERGLHLPGFEVLEKLMEWGISPEWVISGKGSMLIEAGTSEAQQPVPTDRELMGRCIDHLLKLYQELNIKLPMLDMGREAAALYDEIVATGATSIEEYLPMLRVLIAQRRRALLTATRSGKLQDSA